MALIVVTQPGTTVQVSNGDRVIIDIPGGGDVTIVAANTNVRQFRIEYNDDTQADTATVDLSTFQRNDLRIDIRNYDPSDTLILDGAFNQEVLPGSENLYRFDYVGANGQTFGGVARARDNGEKDFTTDPPPIVICFASGTWIETAQGARRVEDLAAGDLVVTLDHGLQPIRWIGRRHLDTLDLAAAPSLRPVTITAGAFGPGRPGSDLTVSPNHRIRVSDWRSALLFGEDETLVPAKALVDGRSVRIAAEAAVTYHHLLFDRHEIVVSNGLPSESLHPGDVALSGLDPAALAELEALFPDLALTARRAARPLIRMTDARALAS